MKRHFPLLAAVCSLLFLSACAPGNQLVVPGELTRPPLSGDLSPGPPRSAVAVAIADFAYAPPTGNEPKVIGRDYDQVRQVVWEGDPGKTMADLVAAALSEKGIQTLRLKAGFAAPSDASAVITGVVRRFEVNVRRRNVLSVYIEAAVGMSLSVTGSGTSTSWETAVSSNAVLQDVFPLPDDFRKALSSAANSAAEEGVRRLQEGGAAGITR